MSDLDGDATVETLLLAQRNKGSILDRGERDTIELVSVNRSATGNLVLFFHRDALRAADPSYRMIDDSGSIKVNKYKKNPNEEQAVSCHLVISPKLRNGGYRCALEEVPGLNISTILHLLRRHAFSNSFYKFKNPKGGKHLETHATIKVAGFATENLEESLKNGRWNMVTLTRSPDSKPTDGLPWLKPKPQIMQIKVDATLPRSSAFDLIKKLSQKAYDGGWEDVRVELNFDDDRSKNIAIDRSNLGRDIMFVKSKLIKINPPVENCSEAVVPQIVSAAETLL
jgi:hypothetical protein